MINPTPAELKIVPYNSQYKQDFIRLNLAWINKYFKVEPQDTEMLESIESLVKNGAEVFFALEQDKVIATCMIIPKENNVWEICKLAADEQHTGKGAGSAVIKACIDYAKNNHAKKIFIVSNTILSPAIHLYYKYGFKQVPIDNMEYERVNIQLELVL